MSRRRIYPLVLLFLLGACQREEIPAAAPDTIPPLPPAAVELDAAHDGLIMFSWLRNTERDIDRYFVYRREPAWPGFKAIDTTTNRFYIDIQRSYDTTYEYYIEAVDRAGNRSAPSAIISASAPNLHAPDAPDIVYATGHHHDGRRYFRIEWAPVEAYDISGYSVFASASAEVRAEPQYLVANTETTFLIDSSQVQLNQNRHYLVIAIDRGGLVSPASALAQDYITQIPALRFPADKAQIRDYPVFGWERVPGAAQYRLSVMTTVTGDEIWSTTITDGGQQELSAIYFGPSLLTGKSYYWRVSTITRPEGDANAVSPVRSFQMVL